MKRNIIKFSYRNKYKLGTKQGMIQNVSHVVNGLKEFENLLCVTLNMWQPRENDLNFIYGMWKTEKLIQYDYRNYCERNWGGDPRFTIE